MSLKCGNDNFGYRHIRDEHEYDWATLLLEAGVEAPWDDFMFYAAIQALTFPESTSDHGDSKDCYTTPVFIVNPQMEIEKKFYPTVVISANNAHVITAFPGGKCRL